MIAELGRHAAPVLAAWSISGVLIVGLIAQTLVAISSRVQSFAASPSGTRRRKAGLMTSPE